MIRKTPRPITYLCLALGTVLLIAQATRTQAAASSPATAAPTALPATSQPDKLQQLEEIWIQGKRLAHRIEDAEDEFFPLYNRANKNHDYDIKCGYAYLSVDTMIMGRTCLANFLGKTYGAPAFNWGMCYGGFYDAGYYRSYRGGYALTGPCVDAGGYEPPSAAFILMAKGEDLRKNMMKVIGADPVLLEKAAHLGDLYRELSSVQNRYRTAKGIRVKGNTVRKASTNPVRANPGPRKL
jgi:hypothetical protein